MFNKEFNALAKNPGLDLYPDRLAAQIDEINEWVRLCLCVCVRDSVPRKLLLVYL